MVCNVPTGLLSALVAQTTATIGWTAPSPIPTNGYAYYVSPLATAPTLTTTPTGTVASSGNAANLSGLTAGTQYYFWIRSICSNTSSSAWSAVSTFTTLAPPAPCNFPTNIAISTITQTTALLSWTAAVPAPALGFGYDYYISPSATSPTATTMATAGANGITSLTLNNLVANTTYYLWMRTNCSATINSVWSASVTFTTLPNAVVCVEPDLEPVNIVSSTTATITWTAPTNSPANGYEYYYSSIFSVPNASTNPLGAVAQNVLSANLSGLTSNTEYFYWVRSVCSATNKSGWSSFNSFTTLAQTSTCQAVLASSIGANAITTTGANIFWIAPSPAPADGYDVYVSTTNVAPTASALVNYVTTAGNIVSVNATNLVNNTTYYVWVRSYCSSTSQSAWTGGYSFTTGTLANSVFDNNSFAYYPNPVTDVLTLKLNTIINKVEVVNMLGQSLLVQEVNNNESKINLSQYPTGSYFVKVNADNQSKTIKILKN